MPLKPWCNLGPGGARKRVSFYNWGKQMTLAFRIARELIKEIKITGTKHQKVSISIIGGGIVK